ncbi:site-specific integrase [Synechococcus sp. EJ6-Ellesmere]|uniref:site-specific integrase n=1 Tax=Synechococcus sp. EJ6-Ellesmere TaxID=2823734 RepID=UPI0020CE7998|nr:site-specific integrase [Synechococcus sp. EJ6-Ellesmere]
MREQRGGVRLLIRKPGGSMESLVLPFAWTRLEVGAILARVRNVYLLTLQGHGLQEAGEIADGKAVNSQRDWSAALVAFRRQKLEHGAAIKPTTWATSYEPVLTMALQLLESGQPPGSTVDLLDACLRDWAPGSRMRQIRAQSLAQFLRHCVEREHFPELWRPPADLRSCIGVSAAATAPGHRKGDALSDLEILALIDGLPSDAPGLRWADALRLLAELGLRPIELQHLAVRQEPGSGDWIWWCSYRKRSGGGMTAPRRIHPLPLTDWDGGRPQWNLLERWRAGLIELPPLGSVPGASDALATYLGRQDGWRSLRQRLEARGERAVPYSFRHGYSLRAHQLGIDPGSVALSMGHSLEVHLRSYPWASQTGTAAAFARALAGRTGSTAPGEVG